jgi:hypothetical protein
VSARPLGKFAPEVDPELVADRYIRSFDHRAGDGLAADSNAPGGRVLVEVDSDEAVVLRHCRFSSRKWALCLPCHSGSGEVLPGPGGEHRAHADHQQPPADVGVLRVAALAGESNDGWIVQVQQWQVFPRSTAGGNPCPLVTGAQGLTGGQMRAIAAHYGHESGFVTRLSGSSSRHGSARPRRSRQN